MDNSKSNISRTSNVLSKSAKKKFKEKYHRTIHNAKERANREYISLLFQDLKKMCSVLNPDKCNIPKIRILSAAKIECDFLNKCEEKLCCEKLTLSEINRELKDRLKILTFCDPYPK